MAINRFCREVGGCKTARLPAPFSSRKLPCFSSELLNNTHIRRRKAVKVDGFADVVCRVPCSELVSLAHPEKRCITDGTKDWTHTRQIRYADRG